jgi:hypothetical protein
LGQMKGLTATWCMMAARAAIFKLDLAPRRVSVMLGRLKLPRVTERGGGKRGRGEGQEGRWQMRAGGAKQQHAVAAGGGGHERLQPLQALTRYHAGLSHTGKNQKGRQHEEE